MAKNKNRRKPIPAPKHYTAFFLRTFLWFLIFGVALLALASVALYFVLANGGLHGFLPLNFWAYFLAFIGVFVVLAALFALFLSARIAGPVARIRAYIEKLAEGDFSQDISIRENDELYSLALALRKMTERISLRLENISLAVHHLSKLAESGDVEKVKQMSPELRQDFDENFKYKKITK